MKNFFHILILTLGIFLPALSYSADLKICDEGITKCQPLIKTPAKYSKCMRLMCYKYYSENEKEDKNDANYYFEFLDLQESKLSKKPQGKVAEDMAKTCDYGLRKCDALSSNVEYYWECMDDSCKTDKSGVKADCDDGRTQCLDLQKIYNDCMKLTCGSPNASFDSCPEARNSCNESLRSYWHCVYKVCLGPVDQYMVPATTKKYMIIKDNKGIKRRVQVNKPTPVISSGPSWQRYAPAGVDPEEWVRVKPQKFMMMSLPSETMHCMVPSALIDCPQDDIRSCRCSDGTPPIMLNGTPSPSYDDSK